MHSALLLAQLVMGFAIVIPELKYHVIPELKAELKAQATNATAHLGDDTGYYLCCCVCEAPCTLIS